jgi:predicted nucleic acid-binding Zn ribbon protein
MPSEEERLENLITKFNECNEDNSYELLSTPTSYRKPVMIRHHCYDGEIYDYELKQFATFIVKHRKCKRCAKRTRIANKSCADDKTEELDKNKRLFLKEEKELIEFLKEI